jgi:hypothetical protein
VLLTTVFGLWIFVTPPYELSILPNVPVAPLLIMVVFGLLLLLLYNGVIGDVSLASVVGLIYTALVWGPFIYLWVICKMYEYPTWFALIPAYFAPLGLLAVSSARWLSASDQGDPLLVVASSGGKLLSIFRILAGVFFGYGSLVVLGYIYAFVQGQGFGEVMMTQWGLLVVIAGGMAGGLVAILTRREKRLTDRAN